jgi:hypothetical protein
MMEITGGCLCKAVRYRISAAPLPTRMCWCRVCQYLAAGNATVNVSFPSNAVSVEGQLTDYSSTADSGTRMHRKFCAQCGTPVFSEAESRPHLIVVRAGTLDDPEVAKPAAAIWVSSAPAWACINEDLQRFEAQPPPVA